MTQVSLRCITIKQPWAYAMVVDDHGRKNIENRSHGAVGWRHRGLTVVHAGLAWSEHGARDPRIAELLGGPPSPDDPRFAFGAAIGVFELDDVHPANGCCEPWGESQYPEGDRIRFDVTHLVAEHGRLLASPVPCRGHLGVWTPSRAVEATIEQQVWAAR